MDLGDALRSWCARTEGPRVVCDLALLNAALEGYARTAQFLTQQERCAIPAGIERIALELTARFLTDTFEECYFKHDPTRFASPFEHNRDRAEKQLGFYEDIQDKRDAIANCVKEAFKRSAK